MDQVEKALKDYANRKASRSIWDEQYQLVGKYVSQTKQSFLEEFEQGEFLNDEIYDSTATFAMHGSSSALLGMLWPQSAKKSVRIEPPDELIDLDDAEQKHYEYMTDTVHKYMDDPSGNLTPALDEYMKDALTFGTSGLGSFWEDDGVYYRQYGVMECVVDEGKKGRVDTVSIMQKWTPERVVLEYGDAVSEKVRKRYEEGDNSELVKILTVYEPRLDAKPDGEGNLNMPYKALHIEFDAKTLLRESGFETFPIHVNRFNKLSYEKYGRSQAMQALPDILEIQILREAVIVAQEKMLDPPLGTYSDSILGGGTIDTSARAINVFNSTGATGTPVFPIMTIGDLNAALQRIETLTQNIAQHFYIDRLLDFNNQTQMTATETTQRANIRAASLSTVLSRQISEVFLPLVDRTVFLLFKHDKLGYIGNSGKARAAEAVGEEIRVIPDRIAKLIEEGKESYTVKFTTAADRANSVEELESTIQFIGVMQQLAGTNPEVLARIDPNGMVDTLQRLLGAPSEILVSKDESDEKIEAGQKQLQQQQGMEQAEMAAGAYEKVSKGKLNEAQA